MPENVITRGGAVGRPASMSSEDVAMMTDKQLGDSNMQRRGLGTGTWKDRAFRGSHDEQIRFLTGMTGTVKVVTVEHDLGRVPGYVSFKFANAPNGVNPPHITVAHVNYDQWTDTTARIEVALQGAGGLETVTVVVLVGGERG